MFIVYTILSLLATASVIKILHISIQPGQWIDQLLDWQKKLQKWDMAGSQFAAKAGGYCEVCFSHVLSLASFAVYFVFMAYGLDMWVHDYSDSLWVKIFMNIVWYIAYVSISTNLGLYFITKLFR